jgi:glycosyltransferase involved in cell wall biosynthesis
MKVSIITPSFNQSFFLEKTIESIISQKGDFDLEYIVIDGGSTDDSVDILKETGKKLKRNPRIKFIWKSEKDKGQSDAINKGMAMASGEIVAFLNSDDLYVPGCLNTVVKKFDTDSSIKWLTGYCQIVNEKGNQIQSPVMKYKNFWLNHYSFNKLLVLNFVSQPSTFWRRELTKTIGLFDEKLHFAMDYDYWLRIGKSYKPAIIKSNLSCFRIHGSSKGTNQYIEQFDQDFETCLKNTKNKLLIILHKLHNGLIKLTYKLIK